ncbi:MAG: [FeFe] hydrogenase H-cluster maturation GTPase HydF [Candidatus Cloacimonadota bacterium]|nr:[FeFe] hydrogenase H-cluster maturation GTPase HydF [Candidatus Cloacimonadota bacterium]
MPKAPRGVRTVIAFTGRRNAGKSSLINAITDQDIAIVSATPGTTTDPVAKSYELIPIGPVTFYDTGGIDDVGELGEKRIKSTKKILWRSDIAVVVIDEKGITTDDKKLIEKIKELDIPNLIIFNKKDITKPSQQDLKFCQQHKLNYCQVSASKGEGIYELRQKLVELAPEHLKKERTLAGDLIKKGSLFMLITPIDLSAPKGRLILPQVQMIREILDYNGIAITVKESEIDEAFAALFKKPDLVITDSQAIEIVNKKVPQDILVTTFSILFARYKGDLAILYQGAKTIDKLEDGDKILIAETCSHNVQCDDIGRYKIPDWLKKYTDKNFQFEVTVGHDFPEDLEKYKLIIHCGACMLNRTEMSRRILEAKRRGVPITNYGIAISKLNRVLNKTIKPFGLEK